MSDERETQHDAMPAAEVVDRLLDDLGPAWGGTASAPGPKTTSVHIPGLGTLMRRGRIWWVRYCVHGKRRNESSKSDDQRVALKLLRKRVQDLGKGQRLDPVKEEKVRMADLFVALETDYANNGRRSTATLKFRLLPLRETFGNDRAVSVTSARIADYVKARLGVGRSRATVNRELAALRRAFTLGVDQGRLSTAPRLHLMAENNARQGFVTAGEFDKIVAALPGDLQDVARFAYRSGWRRNEVTTLEWADVDLDGQRITLRRERSKNGQPRVIPLVGSLAEIIDRRQRVRGECRYVFHRNGRRIRDLRGAWEKACTAAGKPGLLFHDLRRSAVRNLVSAGVDQSVAMRITGHRTVSVFQRYRIVADDDVRAALARTDASITPTSTPREG